MPSNAGDPQFTTTKNGYERVTWACGVPGCAFSVSTVVPETNYSPRISDYMVDHLNYVHIKPVGTVWERIDEVLMTLPRQ